MFVLNKVPNEHDYFFLRTVSLIIRFTDSAVVKEFFINVESFIQTEVAVIFSGVGENNEEHIFSIYDTSTVYAPGIEKKTAYELKNTKKKKDLFEHSLFEPYFEFFLRLKYDSLLLEEINIDVRFLKKHGDKYLLNGISFSGKEKQPIFFTLYNRKNNWILTLK